jgi:uncharacterized membrane protein YhhN
MCTNLFFHFYCKFIFNLQLQSSGSKEMKIHKFLNTFAFIMCGFGDLFLCIKSFVQQNQKIYFLLGIFFFLVAQITFSYLFSLHVKNGKLEYSKLSIFTWFPFLLLSSALLNVLNILTLEKVLMYAITFYSIAITIMAWRAAVRKSKWRLIGSLIFILSDSLIAVRTFTTYHSDLNISNEIVSFAIMSTYWVALYLFSTTFCELKDE